MKDKGSAALRRMLQGKELVVAPGVYDAMSALIVEAAGFGAVYMTGSATSMFTLGYPDVGLITMDEMADNAGRIAARVSVPVISDSDTGFGNAVGVTRTVREFIQRGVAAIHIEDQVSPKRCGHTAGKICVSIEEMTGKVRAAADTRDEYDPDFVVIARSDFRGAVGGSLDGAIERCKAYRAAGADMVFCEGLLSAEELRRVVDEVPAPVFYNMNGLSPVFSEEELKDIGVAVAIMSGAMMTASFVAMRDMARALRNDLSHQKKFMAENGLKLSDVFAFAGLEKAQEMEDRYLPEEMLDAHYGLESVGLFQRTRIRK